MRRYWVPTQYHAKVFSDAGIPRHKLLVILHTEN